MAARAVNVMKCRLNFGNYSRYRAVRRFHTCLSARDSYTDEGTTKTEGRKTHFGFQTVDEDEKQGKGKPIQCHVFMIMMKRDQLIHVAVWPDGLIAIVAGVTSRDFIMFR